MADVVFIAILVAFFGVALLFVKGCERIIGPDLAVIDVDDEADADQEMAA